MSNENKKKYSPDYERQQLFNFFEELCWLLDSNKEINFKNATRHLKDYRNLFMYEVPNNNRSTEESNLIGILPSLLKDQEIFQSNSQLVQFASEVLALEITRWDKKSRNEIIGLIVCEVEEVNKERLNTLIMWSRNILINKNEVKAMQNKAKNSGNMFSWNETIQKLIGNENE